MPIRELHPVRAHVVLAITVGVASAQGAVDGRVDFARDVAPILSRSCHRCHGPEVQRKNLRLDHPDGLRRGGRAGAVLVPGDSARSLLIEHVRGAPGKRRMPADGAPLTGPEIASLERWIDQGARFPEPRDDGADLDPRPWAHRPLSRVEPPDGGTETAGVTGNGIDRFVTVRLRAAGLDRAASADRAFLLRRVSLDLIGLPPDPADVLAFEADERPDAYERQVDRLLASPHFGERWAQHWLDLARYADTKGYEKDDRRTIWRYRDWVIDAFNRDMPFDRFTVLQLAGDLIDDPTADDLLATAFHRNTMTNDEGGTDDEEFRVAAVIDRVNTTFEVWMGTTFACVQCHEHKYDPFEHREYYEVFAFFNQTEDADRPDDAPTIETPTAEQRREIAALEQAIAHMRDLLERPDPDLDAGIDDWIAARREELAVHDAIRLSAWQHAGPFRGRSFAAAFEERFAPEVGKDAAWRERPEWQDGQPHAVFEAVNAANYLRRTIETPSAGSLTLSLGSDDAIKVWVNGTEVLHKRVTRGVAPDQERVDVGLRKGRNDVLVKIVNGGGPSGFYFAASPTGLPHAVIEALRTDAAERTAARQTTLLHAYRSGLEALRPVRDALAELEEKRAAIRVPRTPILRDLAPEQRRETRVMVRGSFLNPGERVEPGTPDALHPWPEGAPHNRLGLARWIVSKDNPLMPRVTVNRFWQQLFGEGLVTTSEDFGTQGERPSHPELLDWLSRQFVDRGFSVKQLLRLIVTSATYRQSSDVRPELLERDPDNRLLARAPRVRLEAETIRDQALAISGLLSRKMFGPSVMPHQPDGVWQIVYSNDRWQTSAGDDRYRRALYTFWRRTSPYPAMTAFGAPSREFCVVKRTRSNTPIQALVTLNDPAFVEMAQAFARRVLAEGGTDLDARIEFAFRACVARAPKAPEKQRLRRLIEAERDYYRQVPGQAARLATEPLGPAPDGQDLAELAAWTVAANVLLNLDETLSRR